MQAGDGQFMGGLGIEGEKQGTGKCVGQHGANFIRLARLAQMFVRPESWRLILSAV
jgi:hypothetical protein